MDNRKNKISGIITELLAVIIYIISLFAVTVIVMR
ncbi:MAG: hypothetical protein K0R92_3369 [Lachnospiraceae bacterium]|nr:hypothetical protein [Lachnospiraceae bacterium]